MRVYVDMDGVLCDYDKAHAQFYDKELNPYPQSHLGFFLHLDPIEGAIEGVTALRRAGHDVFILTRPSVKNPHCWTEKAQWIEKHLGKEWLENIIITCRKDLLCNGSAYLIDDVLHSDAGQQAFDNVNRLIWFTERTNWKKIVFWLGAD